MIRKILLASAGAMALAGSAFAADLPSRAPPPVYVPPPPPPLWTGFYVGINAGYEWSASNSVNTSVLPIESVAAGGGTVGGLAAALGATANQNANFNGFIGGGQIGYNYQFYNNFVAGLEADIQGVASNHSKNLLVDASPVSGFPANSIGTALSVSRSLDYIGTVRGRLGYLFTPTLLVYGTGGLAYGGVNASTDITQSVIGPSAGIATLWGSSSSFSSTKVGWTAGGGVEWLFLPNWSAKIEYLYYDLGTVSSSNLLLNAFVPPAASAFFTDLATTKTHFNGNVVRVGLNYHFNWGAPAPVVAKY
jgi:outer membrane immunogenic protein